MIALPPRSATCEVDLGVLDRTASRGMALCSRNYTAPIRADTLYIYPTQMLAVCLLPVNSHANMDSLHLTLEFSKAIPHGPCNLLVLAVICNEQTFKNSRPKVICLAPSSFVAVRFGNGKIFNLFNRPSSSCHHDHNQISVQGCSGGLSTEPTIARSPYVICRFPTTT